MSTVSGSSDEYYFLDFSSFINAKKFFDSRSEVKIEDLNTDHPKLIFDGLAFEGTFKKDPHSYLLFEEKYSQSGKMETPFLAKCKRLSFDLGNLSEHVNNAAAHIKDNIPPKRKRRKSDKMKDEEIELSAAQNENITEKKDE